MANCACSNIGWKGEKGGAPGPAPGNCEACECELRSWPRYCWYRLEPNSPAYGLEDFSMGGPRVMVGLELLLGELGREPESLADSVLAGASSSFLISEVMSNPRNGFCSLVVRVGDINLLSGELAGDREREPKSVTRRQNE